MTIAVIIGYGHYLAGVRVGTTIIIDILRVILPHKNGGN
jgi:hypothetical protein